MRVFVIAGEASGDALGAALMAALKTLAGPAIAFDGIGGPWMQAEGLVSRFDMAELSLMGLAEILPKYRHLKRRIRETAQAVIETRPDLLVTIDAPDFCLRVTRRVKARAPIRVVHYVAPSVWAWRPGRARRMAAHVDQVLALLPFEPSYMEAAGIACDFVGHPIVADPIATEAEAHAFRAAHGIATGAPLVLVLPGSRRNEVARLAPIFGAALHQFAQRYRDMCAVLVAAPAVAGDVRAALADWPVQPLIVPAVNVAQKRAAFRAADLALAASGTVALELAAADTPMVIAYKVNPITDMLLRRMIRIDSVNLVNIVTDTRHVPECLGRDCTSGNLSAALSAVLEAPTPQRAALRDTMRQLGQGGQAPGLRAAQAILKRMELAGT